MFEWLASQAPGRLRAWDAATGNGQAAVALADHFERVVATDASAEQIEHATRREGVTYRVERSEQCTLPDASCQLVTVAQAMHWLDAPAFMAQAKRVLEPGGLLAVWSYVVPALDDSRGDALVRAFTMRVGPYWPPERQTAENGYRSVAFPFQEIAAPRFEMTLPVTRASLAGYLRTWSATRRFVETKGEDPVLDVEGQLDWPADATHRLTWELHIRAGRNTP